MEGKSLGDALCEGPKWERVWQSSRSGNEAGVVREGGREQQGLHSSHARHFDQGSCARAGAPP